MRVLDMVVDERNRAADLLSTFTAEQFAQQSLCGQWTVHEVAAHLITYLRFGQAKVYYAIVTTAADFDRFNIALTRRTARRSSASIVEALRRGAGSRVSIPRSGHDPVLADVLLHDLDIRIPLGLPREIPEERLRIVFDHLAARPSPGFSMGSRLHGLRLQATDTGWAHGTGAPVQGPAEALVLAMAGRRTGLAELTGDGVPLLHERLDTAVKPGPLRRLAAPLAVLLHPPARRRS